MERSREGWSWELGRCMGWNIRLFLDIMLGLAYWI
jgi:hypothetical protein